MKAENMLIKIFNGLQGLKSITPMFDNGELILRDNNPNAVSVSFRLEGDKLIMKPISEEAIEVKNVSITHTRYQTFFSVNGGMAQRYDNYR